MLFFFFFFFSSRRRHTRFSRDWSSDVCSSDLGNPIRWCGGSNELLVKTVPNVRSQPPRAPTAPIGPTIQETRGPSGPVRTYQDMLQNSHDEDLFEYLATCQI